MRRDFTLPEEDREHLDALGIPWDAIMEGDAQWVVLRGYALPPGYGPATADAAVRIAAGYPDGALDMVFFYPPITRADGRPISRTDGRIPFEGKQWQQWSRHRTQANPWRPGIDSLATHLGLVAHWLERELPGA